MNIVPGKGNYALYHGNLGVAENLDAAFYLINKVFNDIDIPFIIAGQKPPLHLLKAIEKNKNIGFKTIKSSKEILELVQQAQLNILPTFQPTGIKLKLLFALYNGRHCVVNTSMVANTGLEEICDVKSTAEEMKESIKDLFNIPFDEKEINKRKEILIAHYNNKITAEKILQLI